MRGLKSGKYVVGSEEGRKNRIPTITVGEKEKKSEGMIVR